jgi:ABC-type Fe3+/spermidine/putrescine transport system ATPase subunit
MSVADIGAVVRDGRLEQAGAPRELYDFPDTPFVADFLGRVNLIPATLSVDAVSLLGRSFPRPVTALPDGPVLCALRPEKIALAPPEEGGLRGVVQKSTFLGPVIRFIIDAGAERPLVVEQSAVSSRTASPGESVAVRFSPEDLRLFGDASPEAAPMKKEATP